MGTSGCIGSRPLACWLEVPATITAGIAVPPLLEFKVRPVPSATAIAILNTPQTPTAATATAPRAAVQAGAISAMSKQALSVCKSGSAKPGTTS